VDGILFASLAEAKRYGQLKLLEQAGEIRDLRQGRSHDLIVNGKRVGGYKPDFTYMTRTNDLVIEEVKSGTSGKEKDYRLRKKVFEASTGLQVTEVVING
jgi:hypothetical protein